MKYRFAGCEIDIEGHRLLVGGEPRVVEPQVFDLLRHMVENPDRLIRRDELIDVVWSGRIVSDSAISARISAARAAVGDDGTRQSIIKTVPRRGFRFVVTTEVVAEGSVSAPHAPDRVASPPQHVRFCTSRDGTRIAYATTGAGHPLVRAGHWLTHIEHDWQSPVWRPFLNELGKSFQVTRYDQRGNGLSDWTADDFSLDRFVDDLEAVTEGAGLDRFALYGTSQGAAISIAYAARHPHRVSRLVLLGGYVQGRLVRGNEEERDTGKAMLTLIRHGWGKPGSAFLKSFASMYIPGGRQDQIESLAELQRQTTSPENATALRAAVDSFDVSDLLRQVSCPTLVLHARNDGVHPIEQGRALAAGIPDAEFVMLESDNHAILQNEPAWNVLFNELGRFVGS
ncbi:MAG: alpha/beta hydrolase [Rhodospirillaceae bacterium]|jgi:pimeloyl-ACP methyl ester carboxylesterase/DNA-binding winged helix-turn-helix (wHTH) protein|nr:alpha/beta hydrolase [Rhodospirillaceae bacterium]